MFDVAVVGGGITGAGVARDLALRGFRTALFEKSLPGRATTLSSTHLIHGGLRYLLYDRLTTHTTCWDSGNIVRIARPLLTRLPVLWPVYAGHTHGLATVETLLEAYDGFQRMKEGLPHLRLTAGETLRLVPGLKKEGLRGALAFDEWWVDPVALVEANLESARRAGADVRVGAAVAGLLRRDGRVAGVKTLRGGREESVEARLVVNAAGPWVDRVAAMAGVSVPVRLQKGTHLVYDKNSPVRFAGRPFGLLLEAADRGRYVFLVPGGNMTLLGPTDVPAPEGPDALKSTDEEVRYLVASARRYFADFPERHDRTSVGARPILAQAGSEKLLSREFEVFDHEERDGVAGFVTVGGGKMSDFRLMGRETGEAAARRLGGGASSATHLVALDGRPVENVPDHSLPSPRLKKLLRTHPRLRELHALAHLGLGFAAHLARAATGRVRTVTAEEFDAHYGRRDPL